LKTEIANVNAIMSIMTMIKGNSGIVGVGVFIGVKVGVVVGVEF